MIQPADPRYPFSAAEPDPSGPVTCRRCGCRLQEVEEGGQRVWYHFAPLGGRDARGCRVPCVTLPHDHTGRAAAMTAA
jgi:hypothetical protein